MFETVNFLKRSLLSLTHAYHSIIASACIQLVLSTTSEHKQCMLLQPPCFNNFARRLLYKVWHSTQIIQGSHFTIASKHNFNWNSHSNNRKMGQFYLSSMYKHAPEYISSPILLLRLCQIGNSILYSVATRLTSRLV
jgi:hypothetical protein